MIKWKFKKKKKSHFSATGPTTSENRDATNFENNRQYINLKVEMKNIYGQDKTTKFKISFWVIHLFGMTKVHSHLFVAMNSNQALVTTYYPKIIITVYVDYFRPGTVF